MMRALCVNLWRAINKYCSIFPNFWTAPHPSVNNVVNNKCCHLFCQTCFAYVLATKLSLIVYHAGKLRVFNRKNHSRKTNQTKNNSALFNIYNECRILNRLMCDMSFYRETGEQNKMIVRMCAWYSIVVVKQLGGKEIER